MPLRLTGSCRCGAVRFGLDSHTPSPYQLCYCSICRKTSGGGGFAINIMGVAETLAVTGKDALSVYRADMAGPGDAPSPASASGISAGIAAPRCGSSTRPGRTSSTFWLR